jgi:DNA-binding Lrp family transcriptional regulator
MPTNDLLDYYDRLILRELDRDSRKAFSQIASDLGISNTMVLHQRVTPPEANRRPEKNEYCAG